MVNKSNQSVTFKGSKSKVTGKEVHEGDKAPNFKLTALDLSDVELRAFAGKVLILSVVPSVDTPTCAIQTKRFNQEASGLSDEVEILTVSVDLPFALKRFCAAEGIERIKSASDYKYRKFGDDYGVTLPDLGLLTRAIFVIDKHGKVVHVEYVADVSAEPDYGEALAKAKQALSAQ